MVFEDAGTKAYTLQRIGYETAWRFSTLHGRAPGFKVWPATPLRMTVDPTHDASMQVAFALPPKSDVRVTVSATKSFVKVSPRELIFSPTNYNKPQTVTISVAAGSTAATPFDIVFSTTSDDIVCNELSDSWRYVVNRPPVADSQETTVLSDHVTAIHLSGSDPDDLSVDSGLKPPPPITEPLSYSIARQPANGTVKIAGSVAAYTPKPGFTGADRFTFRTKDFSVHSAEATVAFTVKPTTPFERNLLVNGDGELFPFTDFGWVEKSGTWTQSTDRRHSGQAAFYTDRSSSAELYQDVDITSYSKSIKTGDLSFKFEGYFKRNCNEERRGRMSIVLECRDAAGRVLANSAIDDIPGSGRFDSNPFDKQSVSIKAPANTTVLRVKLIAEKPEGRKNNCYFDALSLVPLKPTRDP